MKATTVRRETRVDVKAAAERAAWLLHEHDRMLIAGVEEIGDFTDPRFLVKVWDHDRAPRNSGEWDRWGHPIFRPEDIVFMVDGYGWDVLGGGEDVWGPRPVAQRINVDSLVAEVLAVLG